LVRCPEVKDAEFELIDVGRGTETEFNERRSEIEGKAVLVQHEYPFSLSHIHRRKKYNWAKAVGAAAFIIANHMPGIGLVTGSACQGLDDDIPAIGTSYEGGKALSQAAINKEALIRMELESTRISTKGENVILDIPGQSDEYIVVCAHIDGHDLAESAIDNASGVAVVLETARRLYPVVPNLKRGLRIILFTYEEWALMGSRLYLESLSENEKNKMRLAINLDSVVGSSRLSALVSNRKEVATFISQASHHSGPPIQVIWPEQPNSDHYNFHINGIPSFRLIAGYEEPDAVTRFLLTPADTRDKVDIGQLRLAAMTTVNLVYKACKLPTL
jgi:Zn-dependent M28 family amino/carboxypeptidase